MQYAAIDIGTNAVLLLVMTDEGRLHEVFDASTITRLGEGLLATGNISAAAMERTLAVLERYLRLMSEHGVTDVICFGTAALREAGNSAEFVRLARDRLGLDVRVISDRDEAFYTYLSLRDVAFAVDGQFVAVDIGGGSTEVIRGSREAFKGYVSLPIGTVKLTERFVRHDPPSDTEMESLVRAVREALVGVPREACDAVVGVGGTVTTLAAIVLGLPGFDKQRIEGARLSGATISGVIGRLKLLPSKERLHVPGMERGREDILLQGIILMREIMTHFQQDELIVTTKGARHGFIYEAAKAAASRNPKS